jgi:hypothetical protein
MTAVTFVFTFIFGCFVAMILVICAGFIIADLIVKPLYRLGRWAIRPLRRDTPEHIIFED